MVIIIHNLFGGEEKGQLPFLVLLLTFKNWHVYYLYKC